MALSLDAARRFRLVTNSTESPDIFVPVIGTSFSFTLTFEVPATVSSNMCLLHWANSTDSSFVKITITTAKDILCEGSNAAGTVTDFRTPFSALSAGQHQLTLTAAVSNNRIMYLDGDPAWGTALLATAWPDTALTNFSCGRSLSGTDYYTSRIMQFVVGIGDGANATEVANLWNGGTVLADPTTAISGATGWVQASEDLASGLGTINLAANVQPIFASDNDWTGTPWTQPTIQSVPDIRRPELLLTNGELDAQLVFYSDSFGMGSHRYALHIWNELARIYGVRLKKYVQGYYTATTLNPLVATLQASIASTKVVRAPDYTINESGGPYYMAFPIVWGGLEMNVGGTPSGSTFYTLDLKNMESPWTGPITNWIRPGDSVDAKLLTYTYPNLAQNMPSVELLDDTSDPLLVDLTTGRTTQVVSASPAKALVNEVAGGRRLTVRPPGGVWSGSLNTTHLNFGGIFDNTAVTKGLDLFAVADASFSVENHYLDLSSTSPTDKNYSSAEHNPSVGEFLDPSRKVIFCMGIATEAFMQAKVENWITETRLRATAMGITNYAFLLVAWPVHGGPNLYSARLTTEAASVSFNNLADLHPDVCVLNGYTIVDGSTMVDPASWLGNDANDGQTLWVENFDAQEFPPNDPGTIENVAGTFWVKDDVAGHPNDFTGSYAHAVALSRGVFNETEFPVRLGLEDTVARIPSGSTDRVVFFEAVNNSNQPLAGLNVANFTVLSVLGAAAGESYTNVVVTEVDATNQPGLYRLVVNQNTTLPGAEQISNQVLTIEHTGGQMLTVQTQVEIFLPEGTIPVSQVPVASAQTYKIIRTTTGAVSENTIGIQVGESFTTAFEFARVMADNGRLSDFLGITIKSGTGVVTFDVANQGVDKTQAKVGITGTTAGELVLNIRVKKQDAFGGGTLEADCRMVVNA